MIHRAMRYPNAREVETVYSCLTRTPARFSAVMERARLPSYKTKAALRALFFQRRAVRTTQGWRCRL